MFQELTPLPDAALPVAALSAHLRLGTAFSEEALQAEVLARCLRAALAAIEARTGRALLAREFALTLARWRAPAAHPLPVAPVRTLGPITLVAADGAEQVIAPGGVRLDGAESAPRLVAVRGDLPAIPRGGHVRIIIEAGFGPVWDDLPADLAQAVLMLAAAFYDERTGPGAMPFGVLALLERWRVIRGMGT
ncbi:MAG: hypothetical protein JJU40_07935 [Rhodobacteraceae bacterium]|nr:hypothetical protein [Paracoccaceae bacterium]